MPKQTVASPAWLGSPECALPNKSLGSVRAARGQLPVGHHGDSDRPPWVKGPRRRAPPQVVLSMFGSVLAARPPEHRLPCESSLDACHADRPPPRAGSASSRPSPRAPNPHVAPKDLRRGRGEPRGEALRSTQHVEHVAVFLVSRWYPGGGTTLSVSFSLRSGTPVLAAKLHCASQWALSRPKAGGIAATEAGH